MSQNILKFNKPGLGLIDLSAAKDPAAIQAEQELQSLQAAKAAAQDNRVEVGSEKFRVIQHNAVSAFSGVMNRLRELAHKRRNPLPQDILLAMDSLSTLLSLQLFEIDSLMRGIDLRMIALARLLRDQGMVSREEFQEELRKIQGEIQGAQARAAQAAEVPADGPITSGDDGQTSDERLS